MTWDQAAAVLLAVFLVSLFVFMAVTDGGITGLKSTAAVSHGESITYDERLGSIPSGGLHKVRMIGKLGKIIEEKGATKCLSQSASNSCSKKPRMTWIS